MRRFQFRDGTPYDGPVIQTPDGRLMTGKTYTRDSVRVVEIEDGGERSRELHKAQDEETPVRESKGRGKGRSSRAMVGKKSSKAGKAV